MKTRQPSRRSSLRPVPAVSAPEEVDVTLLFCDVVRSTELTRRLGDRGAYGVIQEFHDLVLRAATPEGGHELELRGDGVLLAFEDTRHAVDCGVGIQRSLLGMPQDRRVSARIGIHTGAALRVATGYFGSNVILSARVAEEAAPGEILVSSAIVQKLSKPGLSVDAGRWVTLKGIPEACLVFSLPWRSKRESFEKPSAWSPAHEAMCLAFGSVRETGSESGAPSCMLGPRGQA